MANVVVRLRRDMRSKLFRESSSREGFPHESVLSAVVNQHSYFGLNHELDC